jgi:broad specificity phosphatase PhoE
MPILRMVEQYQDLVIVVVTSSRDIYTTDAWFAAGMPKSLALDNATFENADHEPGEVAKFVKKPGGVWDTEWMDPEDPKSDLGRSKPEGLMVRHGSTAWNEGVTQNMLTSAQ